MKVAFKDDSFAFEFVRNLGFTYYGGADIGEMMATAGRIKEGDFESWFTEWDKLGRRVLSRAEASKAQGHFQSAREAYLRASTYFRTAEFYLHGHATDPRILAEAKASQAAYNQAADLIGPTWERVEIPYEGTTLPGYFYKVDNSGKPRPTIVFHGGYDSSLEELFFFGAAPAIRRGYNCLTWDGPGQGMPRREQGLPFRYDWEAVVTPAVDYALSRKEVDGNNLVLMGMSLGGYFAARAAAFEHRFRAAVFFDGVYDLYESLHGTLPTEALNALEAGDTERSEQIIRLAMDKNTGLRWVVTQGLWSFNSPSISAFCEETRKYSIADVVHLIQCPCLVMEGEEDMFFGGQPQKVYDALHSPKTLVRFTSEDGAENHCQSGALSYKDEVVFNWIDDTLALKTSMHESSAGGIDHV
jgi:pimeloyl-ACP methyl ester carboxylesterase